MSNAKLEMRNGGAAHQIKKRREVYMGRCPNVVFKSTVTSIAFSK